MERAAANKGQTTIVEPTRAQRAVARRAAESRATVPHHECTLEVPLGAATLEAIEAHSRAAVVLRACALALRDSPRANAAYRDGRWELYSRINVALAVPTEDAYALATVFDADRKPLAELGPELAELSSRELTPPEQSGATFSLFVADGVTSASPVIVPPQAAALAVGDVRELPIVCNAAIVPGHSITLMLACDHRILYGQEASILLSSVGRHLENNGAL
jgi:pyruvate dehydrogenase E2 component (dihydrolipoamide acetyltransferase)